MNYVDVATPSTRKLKAIGFFWTLIMLAAFVVINYVAIDAFTSDDPIVSLSRPWYLLGLLLIVLITWAALGNAVQRFRAAASDDRYFRAGPDGISVSLPDDGPGATFRFAFDTVSFHLPWEQIRTWYPYVESMNGIPTERSIIFENLKGEKVKIKTYHFAEKQNEIVERINDARALSTTDVKQTTEEQVNLPKGLAEGSIEIKKKRDRVHEIDLRTVPDVQRGVCVEKVAHAVEARLASLLPTADGYRYKRKQYRPFPEWKHVFGIRLFVQRGLLSGYEIQVEPDDSECRKLTISMCSSNLITEIRMYLSIAMGLAFVVLAFKWTSLIQAWVGGSLQLTMIAMLFMFLAAAGVSLGLLQIPISIMRLVVSDKQKEEDQKRQIKVGVQEVASGWVG